MKKVILLIALLLSTIVFAQDSTKVVESKPVIQRPQQRVVPRGTKLVFPGGLTINVIDAQWSHIDSIKVKGKVYYHGKIDNNNTLVLAILLVLLGAFIIGRELNDKRKRKVTSTSP